MIGDCLKPVISIGGKDSAAISPFLDINVHPFICLVLPKSIVKADRVLNCAPSIIHPAISVAPKLALRKSQFVRFEKAKQVSNNDVSEKFAPLQKLSDIFAPLRLLFEKSA